MASVGDAERGTGLIGDDKGLQAGVIDCSCRDDVNGGLAVPLGNGVSFVPLGRSFKSKQRKVSLLPSYHTQNGHYGFS